LKIYLMLYSMKIENCLPAKALAQAGKLKISIIALVLVLTSIFFSDDAHATATISRPVNNLGLVGYWDFNQGRNTDIAWDLSGNSNNGKLTSMDPATDWVDSKSGLGTALDFDGTDYVDTTSATGVDTTTITISAWVYQTVLGTDRAVTIGSGATDHYSLGIVGGNRGVFNSEWTTGQKWETAAGTLTQDRWYHLAVTYDGSNVNNDAKWYIDGIFSPNVSDLGTGSGTRVTGSNAVRIGSRLGTSGEWDGKIDEVRIYNRILSADEIKRLYLATQPKIATVPLSRGLVGYWDFEFGKKGSLAFDMSGNGSHGRLTNAADPSLSWVDSKSGLGTALDFDGTDDYIILGNPSILSNLSKATWSMWVYFDSTPNVNDMFINNDVGLTGYQLGISGVTTDEIRVLIRQTTTKLDSETSNANLAVGQWYHLVFTYTDSGSNRLKIYKNGVAQALNVDDGSGTKANDSAETTYIGTGRSPNTTSTNGKIDELRIYNRVLSEDEIKRLYNMTKPKVATVQLDKGLVGYWDFNFGKGGSIAFDRTSNGNNGRLTNMDPPNDWVDSKNSKLGQALDFDGNNDYVTLPSSVNSLVSARTEITLAGWYKGTDAESFIRLQPDSTAYIVIAWSATPKSVISTDGGTVGLSYGSYNIQDGNWHHVAMTWKKNTTNGWVNYVDGSIANKKNSANVNLPTLIGASYLGTFDTASEFTTGKIDDVRIYNRALSADEIQRLYLLGK